MARMFAVIYDDQKTADQAMETAEGLENAGYATIIDHAIITKNDKGKVDVSNETHKTRHGAVVGGVLGGLLGLVFLAPIAVAVAGAAVGGAIGHSESSIAPDFKSFVEMVKGEIPNGGSALVLFGQSEAPDRVMHDLGQYGGKVYSSDFGDTDLAKIQAQVDKYSSQS